MMPMPASGQVMPLYYNSGAVTHSSAYNYAFGCPNVDIGLSFRSFMGHKRLHTSPGVWTIYHALDSDIADPFPSLSCHQLCGSIPHIPVHGDGLKDEGYATISLRTGCLIPGVSTMLLLPK